MLLIFEHHDCHVQLRHLSFFNIIRFSNCYFNTFIGNCIQNNMLFSALSTMMFSCQFFMISCCVFIVNYIRNSLLQYTEHHDALHSIFSDNCSSQFND